MDGVGSAGSRAVSASKRGDGLCGFTGLRAYRWRRRTLSSDKSPAREPRMPEGSGTNVKVKLDMSLDSSGPVAIAVADALNV